MSRWWYGVCAWYTIWNLNSTCVWIRIGIRICIFCIQARFYCSISRIWIRIPLDKPPSMNFIITAFQALSDQWLRLFFLKWFSFTKCTPIFIDIYTCSKIIEMQRYSILFLIHSSKKWKACTFLNFLYAFYTLCKIIENEMLSYFLFTWILPYKL